MKAYLIGGVKNGESADIAEVCEVIDFVVTSPFYVNDPPDLTKHLRYRFEKMEDETTAIYRFEKFF